MNCGQLQKRVLEGIDNLVFMNIERMKMPPEPSFLKMIREWNESIEPILEANCKQRENIDSIVDSFAQLQSMVSVHPPVPVIFAAKREWRETTRQLFS